MRFTFLGTGTSQGIPVIGCTCPTCLSDNPKDKRLRVSGYLETDETKLIIDTGPDFRTQMLQNGFDDLDAVLISHEHNDHVAGIDDVRPINFKHKKEIPFYCEPKVKDVLKDRFSYAFGHNPYPGAPRISLSSFDWYVPFMVQDIEVIPFEVLHGRLPISGFKFGDFAYVTDGKYLPEKTQALLMDIPILVLNALQERDHHSHFTLQEAIEMGQKLRAKKVYLIHMSHLLGKHDSVKLPPNFELAYDGLQLEWA